LVADLSLGDTLEQVAEVAVKAIDGAEMAGLSMLDQDGRAKTRVYTDEDSPQVDQAQYDSGHGPCLDAWRTGRVVRIDDMTTDGRYPQFADAARFHGIFSTLSLPLLASGDGIGALNLYAHHLDAFTADDERIGLELATVASVVLANAAAYWEAFTLGEQLNEAMRTRAVIEQAKGVIMGSTGCDPDGAFDLLRQQSQSENRKLRDIAEEIVNRKTRGPS
jgi:GAF domain-containing protein